MSDELNFLVEAGYNKDLAEKALKTCNNNVQEAFEWLIANQDQLTSESVGADLPSNNEQNTLKLSKKSETESQSSETAEKSDASAAADTATTSAEELTANSLKCDDCGVLLKDEDFATLHAHKTGHTNFSQSTEAIKPKTKEEIEEQKKRLADKLVRLRAEKAERERLEAIESEKARRKQGREISDFKQKFQEDEMKRIAEERRREKLADAAYKQRIKEQIAKDREDKKRQTEGEAAKNVTVAAPVAPVQPAASQEKKQYDECKIQIRLTDGKSIVQTFKATEPLAAVRLWVEMNRTDGDGKFTLMQAFPRKVYTEDDMMRTLTDLSLVPASSLVITK